MKKVLLLPILLVILLYTTAFSQLNLMPIPAHYQLENGKFRIDTTFEISIKGNPNDRIYSAATRMLRQLSRRTGIYFHQDYITKASNSNSTKLQVMCKEPGLLKLDENESYTLTISPRQITLEAENDLGALHGFQTLLQLVSTDSLGYYFPAIFIKDKPRFPWRGLLIDVSRHFEPVNVIKRNLDGMAALKMNVFHWHLTDDQGFRVQSKIFPKLTELGSDGKFYTQAQIKEIIKYASDRGIRVVPEFDIPGHSTSWLVAYPNLASAPGPYKVQRGFGVFDPTFDPTNEKTYKFFDKFFGEMAKLFPDEYVHIGGDENNGKQWRANPKIQEFMKKHNMSNVHELQTYFNKRILQILTKYHKKMIGWDEILQPNMPKSIVIQSWRGIASMVKAAKEGYKSILSSGYYLDQMQSAGKYYAVDPLPSNTPLTDTEKKDILGGEAAMWGEMVTPENIDSRIWPRTAAIAERLWSPQNVKDVNDMYRKLRVVNLYLDELGLTQIKNYGMMLRRMTNGQNIAPLKELVNLVEPVKGYERYNHGITYTSYYPYTHVVDAARPESIHARDFNIMVSDYIGGKKEDYKILKSKLEKWQKSSVELKPIIKHSPILWEADSLNTEYQLTTKAGLEALGNLHNNVEVDSNWINSEIITIEKWRKPFANVNLEIVDAVKELIEAEKIKKN